MPVPSLRVRTCPGAQPALLSLASLITFSVVSGTFIPSLAAGLPARPPSLQFSPSPFSHGVRLWSPHLHSATISWLFCPGWYHKEGSQTNIDTVRKGIQGLLGLGELGPQVTLILVPQGASVLVPKD